MSWFDKLKETASDIAGSVAEEFSGSEGDQQEAPRQEVERAAAGLKQPEEPSNSGPSGVVHKGMEKAASVILGASKKTVDLVVKRVRPSLQLDAFQEPDAIRRIFEVADDAGLSLYELITMGCNTTETVGMARQRYDQIIQDLKEELERLREEGDEFNEELIEQMDREHAEWTSEDHPLGRLLAAVEAAAAGATRACVDLAREAAGEDPSFNNPVVARVMVAPEVLAQLDEEDQRAWLQRALYYRPLDRSVLMTLMELSPRAERATFRRLLELAS